MLKNFKMFYLKSFQTHRKVAKLVERVSLYPSPRFLTLVIIHTCIILTRVCVCVCVHVSFYFPEDTWERAAEVRSLPST